MAVDCIKNLENAVTESESSRRIVDEVKAELQERLKEDPTANPSKVLDQVLDDFINDIKPQTARNALALNQSAISLNRLKGVLSGFAQMKGSKGLTQALSRTMEASGNDVITFENIAVQTFEGKLEQRGLLESFVRIDKDPELQLNLMKELQQINLRDEGVQGVTKDADAIGIAKTFQDLIDSMRADMRKVGIKADDLKGRIMRRVWDRESLLSVSRDEFIKDLLPIIDRKRTLGRDAQDRTVERMLGDFYDRTIAGDLEDVPLTERSLVRERDTYAARVAKGREFHFNTVEDELDILKKYGGGSMQSILMGTVRTTAKALRITEVFGHNPHNTLENLKRFVRRNGSSEDISSVEKTPLSVALRYGDPDIMLDVTTGAFDKRGNPDIRDLSSTLQNGFRMIVLQRVLLSMAPDFATNGRAAARIGASASRAIFRTFSNAFKGVTEEEGKFIYGMLDASSGHMMGMLAEQATGGGINARLSRLTHRGVELTFKYGGVIKANKMQKLSAFSGLNSALLNATDKSFDKLPPAVQGTLLRGGVTAEDWAKIRKIKNLRVDTRFGGLIDTDLIAKSDPQLARRLKASMKAFVDDAIPTPGVRERAILGQGFNKGSVGGALMSSVTNLMSYPVTVMTRQIGREAEASGGFGIAGNMKLAAAMTALGYISLMAKDAAQGRTRDWLTDDLEMQLGFLTDAMMVGGVGGIVGGSALQSLKYGSDGQAILAGPLAGFIDDHVDALIASGKSLSEGDYKKAGASIVRQFGKDIPFTQLPQTKLLYDTLLYQNLLDSLDPSILRRAAQNHKRRTGGQYNFLTGR